MLNRLASIFKRKGFEFYEVGGSVRDRLMGHTPSDMDFCTNATPTQVEELLPELGEGTIYMLGKEFGTICLKVGDDVYEITTYRGEVYPKDSRKPAVKFGNSLNDDLARRDFTINAMARDITTGEITDLFGGQRDIENRMIRLVGDDTRFNEDALRMLRAIRFTCKLDFECAFSIERPERLKTISQERIRDELIKILETDNAEKGIRLLCDYGLMDYIIPEFASLKGLHQGKHHIKDVFNHSLLVLSKGITKNNDHLFRLACLLHDIGKPQCKTVDSDGNIHFYGHQDISAELTEKIMRRLRFPKKDITRVKKLVLHHMSPIMLCKHYEEGILSDKMVKRMVNRIGDGVITDLMLLVDCDMSSSANARRDFFVVLSNMVENALKVEPKVLISPLDGDEIMELLGIKPCKKVGEIKKHLTELVLDGELLPDDKEAAIKIVRESV